MAADIAGLRYRACYATLLRLYPRPFHKRFAEGMVQTFEDLCHERRIAKRGLLGLALWVFFDTLAGIVRENTTHMTELSKTMLRAALIALGLLMVPLVASRLVPGWNWPPGAFVFTYVLFFGTALAYGLIARKMSEWSYKVGVGVALVTGFALGWSNMVHVSDSENPANLWYFSVLLVGVVGAFLARLNARGLARTLFAMATVLALISVIVPSGAPPEMARNMVIGHCIFVLLFAASGLLFRRASLAGLK